MPEDVATPGTTVDPAVRGAGEPWSRFASRAQVRVAGPAAGPTPPGPASRRKEPRYEVVADLLWVQWRDGDEYLGRSARLVNVSRGGAMVISPVLFRERQAVRIFLEDADDPIGVDATVLGVVEGLGGKHKVRLGFRSPCPDAFLHAATTGFETLLERQRPGA